MSQERISTRLRNDQIMVLYLSGTTPKEIAFRLSMSIHVIYKAIERRGGDRRKTARGAERRKN